MCHHHILQLDLIHKWTKISILEITLFDLKMMLKSVKDFFFLEIKRAPVQANSAFMGSFLH